MGRRDSLLIMHQHRLFQLLVGGTEQSLPCRSRFGFGFVFCFLFCKHLISLFLSCLSKIHITKGDEDFVYPAAPAQGLNGLMTHSAFVPAHWGRSSGLNTFLFSLNKGPNSTCMCQFLQRCTLGVKLLFPWSIGTVLCSCAASQLLWLLHFYLEHRCALSPADALQPRANHLLEQMLIFVFQGKMHALWSPGQTGGRAPLIHTFPISSWWLCRHLPDFPVPGALLPNKAAFHSASAC